MSQIRMFSTLDISASGLSAQRARMNVIAQNIANAGTTHTENGEPYRRQEVLLEPVNPNGPVTGALPGTPGGGLAPVTGGVGTGVAGPGLVGGPAGATPLVTDREREAALGAANPAPAAALAAPETVVGGVKVAAIQGDTSDFPRVFDPSHPDADEEGYVAQPNVNMVNEMVDMMLAARAYEANLAVMNASKDLLMRTLSIGKQ